MKVCTRYFLFQSLAAIYLLVASPAFAGLQNESLYMKLKENIATTNLDPAAKQKSLEILDVLIDKNSNNPNEVLLHGILSSQLFDLKGGEQTLLNLTSNKPSWIGYYNLAYNLILQGRLKDGIDNLNKAEKLHKNLYIYSLRGEAYRILGDKTQAIANFEAALKVNPKSNSLYAQIANTLYHYKEYNASLTNINKALTIKVIPFYYFLKGMIQNKLTNWNAALESFDKALNLDDSLSNVYLAKGVTYNALGKYRQAADSFDQATKLGNTDSQLFKAITYYHTGSIIMAKEYFKQAVNEGHSNPEAYVYHGKILYSEGNKEQAKIYFDKALEMNKRNPELYSDLGWFLVSKGEYDEALKNFELSLARAPDNAVAIAGKGATYFALGMYDMALDSLNKSIDLDKNLAIAYRYRGLLHEKTNDTIQSQADKQKTCQLDHTLRGC